jgi:hypothetical protein
MRERLQSERKRQRLAEEEERARSAALELSVPLDRCVGTFANEWFGTLVVRRAGAGLGARLGELELDVLVRSEDTLQFTSLGSVESLARVVTEGGDVVAYELELAGESVRFAR